MSGLDPRAWLAWAFAASLPAMLGRNPWPVAVALLAVVSVRVAWTGRRSNTTSWDFFVKLAVVFAAISVVFNVLTVRTGDRGFVHVPSFVPMLRGELTWNAALYGVLSGIAL